MNTWLLYVNDLYILVTVSGHLRQFKNFDVSSETLHNTVGRGSESKRQKILIVNRLIVQSFLSLRSNALQST